MSYYNLKIAMLQPFSNFEGWPTGSAQRAAVFQRAHGWIEIMQAVGTDMLQVAILLQHTIHSTNFIRSDQQIPLVHRWLKTRLIWPVT